jgi:branched-chain amino acid transport system permease protein
MKLTASRYFVLLIILALIPFVIKGYNLMVVNVILVYAVVSLGYNLILGYTGQFSLAQAAFFGIGAYSSAIMTAKLGFPFWFSMPLAGLIAAIVGIFIGLPSLRLGGIYLAMLTFAFSEFVVWVFVHWDKVTQGVHGLPVPRVRLGSFVFSTDTRIYFLVLIVTVLMVILFKNIINSRIGRALMAIRDSEVAAQALGVDIFFYKILAFALSAFYAGIGGALVNVVMQFVEPNEFGLLECIRQVAMVVIGGLGSILGSILGAAVMVMLPEVLRKFKSLQEVIYGAALLGFVLFVPNGISGLVKDLWSHLGSEK